MTKNSINGVAMLQVVKSSTASLTTCNTTIPVDDTIPQNTEGTEVLTATITPMYSTSTLEIIFIGAGSLDSTGVTGITTALFQDSTANSIAANTCWSPANRGISNYLKHYMTSGTTSSTTFKIRVGPSAAGNFYINGNNSGTRIMGGVSFAYLIVTEYL